MSTDSTPNRASARLTGVLYLLYFVTAVSAEAIVGRQRLGLFDTVSLISDALYVTVTVRFYFLFRPVNGGISLLAAVLSLAGCANDVLNLFKIAPFKVNSLVFFGPYCLLLGYLIFRSNFLPRVMGALMMLAGVGWLIFLSPLASELSTYLKVIGFVAEASLMLWLIVKGVNTREKQGVLSQ